jgi:oligopeptide transport system permease protein
MIPESPFKSLDSLDDQWFIPLEKTSLAPEFVRVSLTFWQDVWRRIKKNKLALFSLWLLITLSLLAIVIPWLSPYTYYTTHLELKNLSPSSSFLFGTDDLGRDIFIRIWYGARISLLVGVSAAIIDLLVGVIWGGTAAFIGGKTDNAMMRFADILYAIPYLLKVILFMVIMGPGLVTIVLAMSLTGWINMARIVRGQIIQLKEQEFVLAAIALGASSSRILFKHLIPNAIGPIIVTVTLTIPTAIFTEAFLSFLGLGIQAPIASWGTMANDGLPALKYYPWRIFFPAVFISSTMLAFNLLGDGLRDVLDPRLRKN